MADNRRDKTFLFPQTTPEELLASKRKLASKQHKTLPHGMPAVDETSEPSAPVVAGGVHHPEAGKVPRSQVEAVLSAHLDAFLEEPRSQIVQALCDRKYTEAASAAEAEAKRFPKNLSLAKAASGVRHYALARLEADLGALFAAPRIVRSLPTGLGRDLFEALRRIDGKTPIETIIRESKVDRLRALDGIAWLTRAGFIEVPRVATPSPGAFVIPVATPAVAHEQATSSADAAARAARASEAAAARHVTPLPPLADPDSSLPAALLRLPDLDPGPPKRSLSLQGLPSPSALQSEGAAERDPTSERPHERLLEAPPESRPGATSERAVTAGPAASSAPPSHEPAASAPPAIAPVEPLAPSQLASHHELAPISSPAPSSRARPTPPPTDRDLPTTPPNGLVLGLGAGKPRAKAAPVLAGVAALGIAAAGLTLYRSHTQISGAPLADPSPHAPPATAPPSAAPTTAPTSRAPELATVAPELETISVEIDVTPKYARVFIDGVLFTGPQVKVTMPKDGKRHEVRIESPGFTPRTTSFEADANASLIVALNRLPAAPPRPATASPGSAEPRTP